MCCTDDATMMIMAAISVLCELPSASVYLITTWTNEHWTLENCMCHFSTNSGIKASSCHFSLSFSHSMPFTLFFFFSFSILFRAAVLVDAELMAVGEWSSANHFWHMQDATNCEKMESEHKLNNRRTIHARARSLYARQRSSPSPSYVISSIIFFFLIFRRHVNHNLWKAFFKNRFLHEHPTFRSHFDAFIDCVNSIMGRRSSHEMNADDCWTFSKANDRLNAWENWYDSSATVEVKCILNSFRRMNRPFWDIRKNSKRRVAALACIKPNYLVCFAISRAFRAMNNIAFIQSFYYLYRKVSVSKEICIHPELCGHRPASHSYKNLFDFFFSFIILN